MVSGSGTLHAQGADYYRTVHAAERNVIAENYKEAVVQYKEAFRLIYPFLLATLDVGPTMEQELALKWKDSEVKKNE